MNDSPKKPYYSGENNIMYFRVNISHKKDYYSRDKMILLFRVNNIKKNLLFTQINYNGFQR